MSYTTEYDKVVGTGVTERIQTSITGVFVPVESEI